MEENERSGEHRVVPVFPLPNRVFFPRTVLPLHVFEPRYRQLVSDASSGDGRIAVSLLADGWEDDYAGSPPFEPVGTIGRIDDLRRLVDGRFLVCLVGVERVRLGRAVHSTPYRLCRFETLAESLPGSEPSEVRAAKLGLLAAQRHLLHELGDGRDDLDLPLNDGVALEVAVNGACSGLPVPPALRQSLLEEDDLLRRLSRVSDLTQEILEQVVATKTQLGEPLN